MFAVIPHPTEELILSRAQKAFLSRLNAEAGKSRWVPVFPLWAFFNAFDCRAAECDTDSTFDTAKLKTIRNAIASFTIDAPEISNGEFFFPVALHFRNGALVSGKILAGKTCGERSANGAANTVYKCRSTCSSLRNDKKEAPLRAAKKINDDADVSRDAENEKKSFERFPYSCNVFRIADAEIGDDKIANDENAADKIVGKRAEDTGDTGGIQLRTWHVNASLWVKVGR